MKNNLTQRTKWISIEDELPVVPCLVYWSDGIYTILDVEDDISYAISEHPDKVHILFWSKLPNHPLEGLSK